MKGDAALLVVKNLLFTLLVPGTVGVYVPIYLAGNNAPKSGILLVIAGFFLVLAAAIYGWCLWDFATFGRGTPAPIDEPRKLVVRGLYRYTRNPMYLGVLTAITGWAILYASPRIAVYAVIVALIFHCFVWLYEEPHLRKVFGAEYEAYCLRVNRWLPRK